MTDPTVSVVMTAYNGADYIAEAIQGVLDQTFSDFELLVIDDGSADRTPEIVRSFKDPRLVFVQNKRNSGISNTRNRGTALARGLYLAAHDQDDVSYPDRLQRQVEVLQSDPDVVLVAGYVDSIPSRGPSRGLKEAPPPEVLAWTLFTGSMITHSTICMRLDALRRHGIGYEQRYHYAEDFELFHRLSEVGKLVMLPHVLGGYRHHDTNASRVKRREMTENGRSFLRKRYCEYLGGEVVGEEAMAAVWDAMVENQPAKSEAELLRVGDILNRLARSFIDRRGLDEELAKGVRAAAAEKWSQYVVKTARAQGPSVLRLSSAFDNLRPNADDPAKRLITRTDTTLRFLHKKVMGRSE